MANGSESETDGKLQSPPQRSSTSRLPESLHSQRMSTDTIETTGSAIPQCRPLSEAKKAVKTRAQAKTAVKTRKPPSIKVSEYAGKAPQQEKKQPPEERRRQYRHCKEFNRIIIPVLASASSTGSAAPTPTHQQLASSPPFPQVVGDLPRPSARAPAHQSWHNYKNDDGERRTMITNIIDLLRQRTLHRRNSHKPPPGWDLILMPRVAKEFEVSMYRTAATLDEYKDLSTLRRRLRGLVERIRTTKTPASSSQKRSPAVTAISEEEKQMTVDLKEWQSRQQHRQQTKRDQLLSRQRLLANTGAVETARQYVQATTNDVRVAPLSVVDAAVDANASDAHSGDGGVLTSASAQPGMKEERSPPAPAVTVAKSETSITRAATKSIPCQCHSSLTSMARPQLVASSSVILGNSSPLFCSAPCASSPPPPPHQLAETEGILAKRHVGASSPRFVATCSPVICEMASSDAYVASSNKHHLPTFLKQKPISSARTYSALSQTIQTSEKQPSASTMTTHPGMSPLQQSHPVLQWPQTSFVKSPQESNPYQNPQENHHFNHGHGHLENGEGLHLVQQQRLLLLYHASQCRTVDRNVGDTAQGISDSSCPVTPHCATMKLVWNHVLTCEKPNCRVPHCNNSRIVLEHYRQCDKGVFCTICAPVRHRIRKDQQIQQSHGLSDHLELEPEAGFPPFSTKAECASPNRAVGLLKEKKRQLPQERSYSLLRDTTNYSVKLDEPSKMGRRVVSSKETSGSTYFYRSIERDEPTAPKTMQPRYVSSEATSATKTPSLRE